MKIHEQSKIICYEIRDGKAVLTTCLNCNALILEDGIAKKSWYCKKSCKDKFEKRHEYPYAVAYSRLQSAILARKSGGETVLSIPSDDEDYMDIDKEINTEEEMRELGWSLPKDKESIIDRDEQSRL